VFDNNNIQIILAKNGEMPVITYSNLTIKNFEWKEKSSELNFSIKNNGNTIRIKPHMDFSITSVDLKNLRKINEKNYEISFNDFSQADFQIKLLDNYNLITSPSELNVFLKIIIVLLFVLVLSSLVLIY
jgi:hypothetical protein